MAAWRRVRTIENERRDRRLDQLAREAGAVIKASVDPAFTMSRLLILIGDEVQTQRPGEASRRATAV